MLIAAISSVFFSCTKSTQDQDAIQNIALTEQDALEQFAVVLSKAVTGREEVRSFLKEEALKQFDKDYDVFYPYVKDHEFSFGMSFRQVLSSFEEYEGQLSAIERAAPKLTMLAPDFSWVDSKCFSVNNWDTTNDSLCVGFDDNAKEHKIFFNGELLGSLPADSFPSFPVLIVKSNERMCVSSATKSGEIMYEFANPAFNGINDTKSLCGSVAEYWYNPVPGEDLFSQVGNFVTHSELNSISPSCISAFNEFSTGTTPGVQRDYVYYGMTKQNATNGVLNPYMRDMLYRFRITPVGLFFISDDNSEKRTTTEDPGINIPLGTGRGDRPEFTEAISRIWGKGRYEMRLLFYQAYPNSGVSCVGDMVLSLSPSEIMYVDKCYRTFQWNIFGNNWSSYTITASDIESKWYYPGDKNNPLPIIAKTWNLSKESNNLIMKVLEYDPSGTITITENQSYKKSDSVTFGLPEDESDKVSLGIISGDEESWTVVNTITVNIGSDDMGNSDINYVDNYILTSLYKNGNNGYQLKAFGNEYYAVSFLPIDIREEYQIQQFLLGRKSRN